MKRVKCKLSSRFAEVPVAVGPNDYLASVMAKAKETFDALVAKLGGKCAWCGDDGRYSQLTVDHIDGITWDRNNSRYDARVKRYMAEYEAGVRLRVLCHRCNSIDGRQRQLSSQNS